MEENIGRTVDDTTESKILYDPSPRIMEIKAKANSSVQSLIQASLSITKSQSLLKLMPIDLVMPSKHLILCHSLLLLPSIFPSKGSFSLSQFFLSGGQSFSFIISPSNEYSGMISFRMNWLDLLAVQGTIKSLLQHHSLKASFLQVGPN